MNDDGCRKCKKELAHVGGGFFACANEKCDLSALIQAFYIDSKG